MRCRINRPRAFLDPWQRAQRLEIKETQTRTPAGRLLISITTAAPIFSTRRITAAGRVAFARLMGQWLSERLGQPFVIENRPGAGGNTGTEAVVRAAADG